MAAAVRTWSYLSSCACLQSWRCLNMYWWACSSSNESSAWWLVFCPVCAVSVLIWQMKNTSLINSVTWLNPVLPNVLAIIPPHLIQYGLLLRPKVVLPNVLTADCDVEHVCSFSQQESCHNSTAGCLSSASNIPSATCCASQLVASSRISGFISIGTIFL